MTLALTAVSIGGGAVFPRLSYWARWPTRLSLRRKVAYTAFNALLLFAVREFARYGTRLEAADELGHEPEPA